jgi:hypothetical protein
MLAQESYPYDYLINEAASLICRLKQVKPFSMTMPMVKGASVSSKALDDITNMLEASKNKLYGTMNAFIKSAMQAKQGGSPATVRQLQSAFIIQKLRFNSILDQLDIFADVLSQRAEHEVGIWLSGLDVFAEDGLAAGREYFEAPSLMVFLERGHGAAIRRARTRLPGGDMNPVAVIQIPRERMVSSGIGSSLIHEVGHQAAESMELTKSLREKLAQIVAANGNHVAAWKHYERWISEIIADCWATGLLGIGATLGLMGVVTLPKYFQFRLDMDDPHPAPYVRVKLSCAFGKALYPHEQWDRLWALWKGFYPIDDLASDKRQLLEELDAEEQNFVQMVLGLRAPMIKGKSIAELFPLNERQPERLQSLFQQFEQDGSMKHRLSPTLLFAVLGQAKFDHKIKPEEENAVLSQQLRSWAYNRK